MTTITASAPTVTLNPDTLENIKFQNGISSDRQLALRLGISHPLLSQIKSGYRGVSALFITRMLTELGVPFNFDAGSLYRLEGSE